MKKESSSSSSSSITTTTTSSLSSSSSSSLSSSEPSIGQEDAKIHINSNTKSRCHVLFSHVEIIELPIILGDSPSVSSGGPPLSIGWETMGRTKFGLDFYEKYRPPRKSSRREMLISSLGRTNFLLRMGYSIEELEEASIKAAQFQKLKRMRFPSKVERQTIEQVDNRDTERTSPSPPPPPVCTPVAPSPAKTVKEVVPPTPAKRRSSITTILPTEVPPVEASASSPSSSSGTSKETITKNTDTEDIAKLLENLPEAKPRITKAKSAKDFVRTQIQRRASFERMRCLSALERSNGSIAADNKANGENNDSISNKNKKTTKRSSTTSINIMPNIDETDGSTTKPRIKKAASAKDFVRKKIQRHASIERMRCLAALEELRSSYTSTTNTDPSDGENDNKNTKNNKNSNINNVSASNSNESATKATTMTGSRRMNSYKRAVPVDNRFMDNTKNVRAHQPLIAPSRTASPIITLNRKRMSKKSTATTSTNTTLLTTQQQDNTQLPPPPLPLQRQQQPPFQKHQQQQQQQQQQQKTGSVSTMTNNVKTIQSPPPPPPPTTRCVKRASSFSSVLGRTSSLSNPDTQPRRRSSSQSPPEPANKSTSIRRLSLSSLKPTCNKHPSPPISNHKTIVRRC